MPRISESIPDLLGGVSQMAPQRREVNEVESLENVMLRPAEGVVKRPPTQWIAEVAASASAYSGAFVHTINKNANERFWVIVLDGDLKVFNAVSGVEVPVTFPDGKTYLDVVASPNEAFRLATFNDTTVIVNRETVVDQAASLTSQRGKEALIVVNQTDFGVQYSVGINFSGTYDPSTPFQTWVDYWIPAPTSTNQRSLNTSNVASNLRTAINDKWGSGGTNHLVVTTRGNTIVLTPGANLLADNEFVIRLTDGLGNQGMDLLQDSIQSVEQLPAWAPDGFTIRVEGDPDKTLDDVYYRFSNNTAWVETAKGGIPDTLDATTLPLELVANPNLLTSTIKAIVPVAAQVESPKTAYTTAMLQTQDGTASTRAQAIMSPAPTASVDRFWNLGDANGADILFHLDMLIDQTNVVAGGVDPTNPGGGHYAGDLYSWELSIDTGAGFTVLESEPIGSWQGQALQFLIGSNISAVPANSDIRLRVTSNSGNKGSIAITPTLSQDYEVDEGQRIFVSSTHYAPGTAMTFTLNGTGYSDTYVAGGTQSAYMTNLKTTIEAYGGAAVTVTINTAGGYIDINNDDGTQPTLATFTFDDGLDLTTELFNGGVDFTTFGIIATDIIKNATDTSAATVSAVAATIITHGGLTGGVNNTWSHDDDAVVNKTATEFICRQPVWAKRLVGSLETNKWPSFKDETINEVSFLKNRLILLSDENVAMSEVDEFFNFFRSSTIDVLDSDRIDVALSGNKASALHSALTWNETLLTWSELGQFAVNGEPFLSPNTVRREATTSFVNTRKVRPVTSERSVYFLTEGNEYAQLYEYRPEDNAADATRLSVKVPRYMPGTPRGLLAVSDPELVLVLTATNPDELYVFTHLRDGVERQMAAWHKWTFPGVTQILGIGSIDNEVSLIFERDDGKVHLEVLDLWKLSETTVDGQTNSDDHPTPPAFTPVQATLGEDLFEGETDGTFLSAHTPDTGFGAWVYSGTESGASTWNGGHITNTGKLQLSTGTDSYHATTDVGSEGDIHFYVDMNANSFSAGQFPQGTFLWNAPIDGSYNAAGIGIQVDSWQTTKARVYATRYARNTLYEHQLIAAIDPWTVAAVTGRRIGCRMSGLVATLYTADVGTGANETPLGSPFTFGTLSSTFITDLDAASQGGFIITSLGTQSPRSNRWEFENVTLVGPTGASETVFTPPGPNPDDFTGIVGIDESGGTQTLTPNGDGTASWPTADDVTSQNIVVGLPVTSTIQLSKLYHRKDFGPLAGRAEVRGNTYIQSLLLGLESTSVMSMAVAITGHATFTQDLTEPRSLDAEYMHVQVGGRNTETTLTLTHTGGTNFKLVGIDWEGSYYHRIRRTS